MKELSQPIAILGATSQLAKDFIREASKTFQPIFRLYARSPDKVNLFQQEEKFNYPAFSLNHFGEEKYSAIINFIGVGDPARAKAMGADIFAATLDMDQKVLAYLTENPSTTYIFMSSGAVYGTDYLRPVNKDTASLVPINNLQPHNYYSIAKLYAEARHRALPDYPIFDIRIFNYISRTLDLNARFLITDMINAIRNKTTFETDNQEILRDFLHPKDFCHLIQTCLNTPKNMPLDAYSKAPIKKITLLEALQNHFGLKYRLVDNINAVNATGRKPFYYSENRDAHQIGYSPQYDSLSGILEEVDVILNQAR
jgi:nucleoside-diphosphate-sugar epimerase